MYWVEFLISAVVIVFAGIRLTVHTDRLSDRLQLGKVWIGIVLLGVVTSLPEAIASLTSIISLGANDLAVGNLLGSNNFNPMLIVVMDVLYRQGSVTNAIRSSRSHVVSARYAILLTFLVIADILLNRAFPRAHFGPLSVGSVAVLFLYFVGIRHLARLGMGQIGVVSEQAPGGREVSLKSLVLRLFLSAVFVVVAAMWLARSADRIALETGLGETFVGSFFLAVVTSLPEMVVSLSALKLGALDLAIGNIFGSNMANMFILSVCGFFHRGAPLLSAVSPVHIGTGVLSLLLMFITIAGVRTDHKKTFFRLGLDSILMILVFAVGSFVLYRIRAM